MVKRIHVIYRLAAEPELDRAVVERVRGFHAAHCPVARSIGSSIDINTEVIYS